MNEPYTHAMNALTHSPRNASAWISIAEFLDAQWLASFGLKRVARKGPACGKAPREAHPVGNTGTTYFQSPTLPNGELMVSGVSHG